MGVLPTVVLGGTFDPVHSGHVQLVEYVLQEQLARQLVLMPVPVPPHKSSGQIISFRQRFAMLRLAFSGLLGQKKVVLSVLEKKLQAPQYTYLTMRHMQKLCPGPLALLLGADMFAALDSWQNPAELKSNYRFLVAGRNHAARAASGFAWPPVFLENPPWPVSSSQIRALLQQYWQTPLDSAARGEIETRLGTLLPAPVLSYILHHKLYLQRPEKC